MATRLGTIPVYAERVGEDTLGLHPIYRVAGGVRGSGVRADCKRDAPPTLRGQSPADLKHPNAKEGVRVDLHLQCYLAQGSAFVYLVPKDGDWVIVDYMLQ